MNHNEKYFIINNKVNGKMIQEMDMGKAYIIMEILMKAYSYII